MDILEIVPIVIDPKYCNNIITDAYSLWFKDTIFTRPKIVCFWKHAQPTLIKPHATSPFTFQPVHTIEICAKHNTA